MGVPNQFIVKTVIESAKVNQNFAVACFSGEIRMYGSDVAPIGWLLCDGASYLRADYADLFAIIGTRFGSIDTAHFSVPNLKGNVPVGKDPSDVTFQNIGNFGGAKTHTLAVTEIPSHNHGGSTGTDAPDHAHYDSGHGHYVDPEVWMNWNGSKKWPNSGSSLWMNTETQGGRGRSWVSTGYANIGGASARHTHSVTAQGGGSSHNNLQPYLVVNFIIKT